MVDDLSLWRIVKNDYPAFFLMIGGPAGVAAVATQWRELSAEERPWAFAAAGVLGAFLAFFLWRRIDRVRHGLLSWPRVPGTVVSVWFHSDRGRLEFRYEYGTRRTAGAAINKTRDTERLYVGQQIELAVDPNHPSAPLVVALYSRSGFAGAGSTRAGPHVG